jgi:hypothetical protein
MRLAHQIRYGAEVICLGRVSRQAIGPGKAAPYALLNDHQPFARPVAYPLGSHQAGTVSGPISWMDVDVLRPQAVRTVISVAAVRQRGNGSPAVLARETLVLGGSADGSASRLKK